VTWKAPGDADGHGGLPHLLHRARRRRRVELIRRSLPIVAGGVFLALSAWWTIGQLNQLDRVRVRDHVMREIVDTQKGADSGRSQTVGRVALLARDPARSDVARFNALVLASSLLAGHREARWYIKGLNLERVAVSGAGIDNNRTAAGPRRDADG
jgi:hypothetical protein